MPKPKLIYEGNGKKISDVIAEIEARHPELKKKPSPKTFVTEDMKRGAKGADKKNRGILQDDY